jgi:PAS domain S-box-containing protein
LESADGLLEAIQDACLFLDRNWRVTYLNLAGEAFFGRPREELLGRNLLEEFPAIAGSPGQLRIGQAFADGQRARFETISAVTGSPIELDIHPHSNGVTVFIRDIRVRWALQDELRERDARLRLAEESAGVGIWDIDVVTDTVRGTAQFFRIMGLEPTSDPVPMKVLRGLRLDGDRDRVNSDYVRAVEENSESCDTEYRIRRPDGELRWIFGRGRILRDKSGAAVRYSGVDIDVTERRATEHALAESEDRLRLAIQAAQLGTWDWNLVTNEMTWSDRAKEIGGFPLDKPVSFGQVRAITHPDDLPRTSAMAGRALDPELKSSEPYEYRIVRPDGTVRWVLAHGEARFTRIGGVEKAIRYAGTIQDITERKAAEQHRELMHAELQHRVNNTLALVGAIANQTFAKSSRSTKEAFTTRLGALAKAHEILSRERWQYASCREVIDYALAPFRTGGGRFSIEGPDLLLDSKQAVALALCINELATNAAKYGALSKPEGRVQVTWALEQGREGKNFVFRWTEKDGPAVGPPARPGFGTRLIQQSLAADFNGKVEIEYRPTGLVCSLRAPWKPTT